jgi:hypothetical protein
MEAIALLHVSNAAENIRQGFDTTKVQFEILHGWAILRAE